MKSLLWIIFGGAACIFIYLVNNSKKNIPEKNVKQKNYKEIAINKIKERLRWVEEKYEKSFLAYALYKKAIEYNLKDNIREEIEKQYGRVVAMPPIDFVNELGLDDFRFADEAILEYLNEKNFKINQGKDAANNFRYYLFEKAKEKAEEEIKKFK